MNVWLDIVVTLCTISYSIGNGSSAGADEASWKISGKLREILSYYFDVLLHVCG